MLNGRRIGLRFPNGEARYYDIDADARVYWLQPRGGSGLLQRWRVRDPELAEYIRKQADLHCQQSSVNSASSIGGASDA